MKYTNQVSENRQNDIVTSKISSKVLQNFMKCTSVLIQHVENILCSSPELLRVNKSLTITTNIDDDIDIIKHNNKQEFNKASRYLRKIKKCVVQISLLCLEQNIYVNDDISGIKIEFYSYLDVSRRSLIINYLTENIVYLIEHIGFIISNFKEEKGREDLKHIKKSLLKIYKQIIFIPINQNLDETPACFQNLNQSQWYSESIQNLLEKLALLKTALIKFKKAFIRKLFNGQYDTGNDTDFFENVDLTPYKNNVDSKEICITSDHVFLVPDVSPLDESNKNGKEKQKKKKHQLIDHLIISDSDSDNNKVKKKHKKNGNLHSEKTKSKTKHKNKVEIIVSDDSDHEKCKKRKYNEIITLSDSENKKKHKNNSVDPTKENKKRKHKKDLKHSENAFIEISDSEKKHMKNKKTDEIEANTVDISPKKNSSLQSPSKMNRNKNDSESSVISIGNLFTSHMEIGDDEISIKEDNMNNKGEQTRFIESKSDISHGIFDDSERMYLTDSEKILEEILQETKLTENERFLHIQTLLREAKEIHTLSEDQKEKLSSLCILIDWDLPPAHEIQSRISLGPLPHEFPILKELGVTFKKYNLDEDNIIRKNWEDFCKIHDLDNNPAPFLKFKHGHKVTLKFGERKKFVQFLGRGLPNRTLNGIYKRFKILFRTEKSGRFSAVENELIKLYCSKTNSPTKFAELAHILNRPRPAIEQRYRILYRENNERIKWTLDIQTELVEKLLKATGLNEVNDLKDAKISAEHFKKVANEMQIPWGKIKMYWTKLIYSKLFAEKPLLNGKIRTKIITLISKQNVTDWRKIDWNAILKHFKGITVGFLWHQLTQAVVKVVPKKYYKDLGKVLVYCKKYIDEQKSLNKVPFTNSITRRYRMTENGIETYV